MFATDTLGQGALTGITVLDLGQAFMGPYCALLLQRLGADVIKVEPLKGEPYRRPTVRKGTEMMQFGLLNAGKRSVSLDLKNPEGRELFLRLAATADVVIQNFAPGTFDRLIGVDAVLDANPRLILASGSGYGSTGPYRSLRAMDLTVQAMSGVMATTGFPDGIPVRTGPSVVDFMGGAHLTAAVLAALVQRSVTGKGQHVEVALYDAILPSLASNIGGYLDNDGAIPERTGNRHGGLEVSPYNSYKTQDGWAAILCLHDRHWASLCRAMERPELIEDPAFKTGRARAASIDRVDAVVEAWTSTRTTDDVIMVLSDAGIACAPVKSLREVITDPQVAERGMLRYHSREDRDWWTLGSPLRLSDSPAPEESEVPRLGEHTAEVLAERLLLERSELEALDACGVTGTGTEVKDGYHGRSSLALVDTADS
ncbi:CaiB/BaiF CoA-transferase family protein [Conexibacter sp. S30A1]|uniref:CaiB/BaiF CoA transferase family protein n=1 Tax=Conexibacter sp. S30A1 TaxID=2937800 RepID=UPI00200C989B|nr:CoA transferase [Conexibacter sp. S30A1]